ncbi:MAG: hypothetical protein ACI9XC_002004 [Gammaproteobacteria bacterium]|jgi:hypothetical protein
MTRLCWDGNNMLMDNGVKTSHSELMAIVLNAIIDIVHDK